MEDKAAERKPTTTKENLPVSSTADTFESAQSTGDPADESNNHGSLNEDPEKGAQVEQEDDIDPNVVNWDGPDDPEKAVNWKASWKWTNVATISSLTLLTPLASSMFAPGVPDVMREFKSDNIDLATFVVSVFVLGYTVGPIIIAPMSELYGRLVVYHVNNVLFIIFSVACALSNSLSMLIVFRFLAGCAGSCPLTVGGGSLSDMYKQEGRGAVMAIWSMGPLLGPVIGPICGGFMSQDIGWRWTFWVLAIAMGVVEVLCILFARETYEPVLLERRAARLRKETGNPNLRSALKSTKTPRELFLISIVRPTKMLFLSPIVFGTSLFVAINYGYLYLLFSTMTEVFEGQYGISTGNVGLTYLGIGIGCFLGLVICGIGSDILLKRMAKGGEMKPEYRLPPLIIGGTLVPIGLFWYGWSAQSKIHWIMPIIGTFWVGTGLMCIMMPVITYLIDAFTIYAASAMAANTVFRSLGGALLPLCARKMYAALGLGWGNSLLGFISIAMCPMIWVFIKYGERIRKHPRFQLNL